MAEKRDYYIGLDCGTNSVGWAVTDEKYNILRARGKRLWGMRLFEEANTAADRRLARSTRRRGARAKQRIKLLQMLFREEMAKVDPNFYLRLQESFFWLEDKDARVKSKNTLFDDVDYKDKDFHKKYPTIWHLRQAIVHADSDTHFDIREYYLAIEHIIKHRGHFLREGKIKGAGNFDELWDSFCVSAAEVGYTVREDYKGEFETTLKVKGSKTDKKKKFSKELFAVGDESDDEASRSEVDLAGLLVGSKVSLKKMFGVDKEEDLKYSFSDGAFEDKVADIEEYIADVEGGLDLILAAKAIYDYAYLSDLLAGNEYVSDAMVNNYVLHQKELKQIKEALKPYEEDYKDFFKKNIPDNDKDVFYAAYVGKAYTEDKSGRRKSFNVNQEDLNKKLKALFEKHGIGGELLEKSEEGVLLPKQRGQAKGTIPEQLHHNELEMILEKLCADFPTFGATVVDEPENYNTKAKKIERLHDFRIPYYCGPMNSKNQKVTNFSWGENNIVERVYPWNYAELVNLGERADKFIARMTNECTYLLGEDVLPKCSFAYQKYMVLNELNNLKINGKRIDNELKQKIFEQYYLGTDVAKGNTTLRKLTQWMKSACILGDHDELGGTNDVKVLPKLSAHNDFKRILGDDYEKKYGLEKREKVVRLITVLNNERKMLAEKIQQELDCSEDEAKRLSKLNYKDWGRLSGAFLNLVRANVDGVEMSILEALWNTNKNLMELLSKEYEFKAEIDRKNKEKHADMPTGLTYDAVKELYCSPAVKRTVWQAIKIVKEIVQVMGCEPRKVFLEVTRGEEKGEKKIKLARRQKLIETYKAITKSEDSKRLLDELNSHEDRDLQQKKLYLYFMQMGRCAYCGKPIDLHSLQTTAYDIDHIIPRSWTKDDSLTKNLVLVHAEENREKTNRYPIEENIREKMRMTWGAWCHDQLITKEKYDRLTRVTPLTDDERAGFVARQIVETSQSVKAIRDLLQENMEQTKVVMVKAGSVSDFRHYFARGEKYKDSDIYRIEPRPEFIKIRELNDIHHAKDAYLNIVVGNVMDMTFTSDPYNWMKKRTCGDNYTIATSKIFRSSEEYESNGKIKKWPEVSGWDFQDSIDIVSKFMKRNDVSWTRMNFEQRGALYDLQIVGKCNKTDGILPIKKDTRLAHTEKYGGYRSSAGAYFALIEDKKGDRRLVVIPSIAKNNMDEYLTKEYGSVKVIIPKINYKSYLKINGYPVHITGRSGSSVISSSAKQLIMLVESLTDLKAILSVNTKLETDKKYEIDCEKDRVDDGKLNSVYRTLAERLKDLSSAPYLGGKYELLESRYDEFTKLELKKKIQFIGNLLRISGCDTVVGDISSVVPKAGNVGKTLFSCNITDCDSAVLILQSPTGLFEKKIDLKTTPPITLGV